MRFSIIICAHASSGKTTLAKQIARKYKLKYYDGGDILKLIAKEEGYRVTKNWHDTKEGIKFLEKRNKDLRFDKKLDKKMLSLINRGGVVITSWTMPWLSKKGIKIWLEASKEARAKRLAERDKITYREALKITKQRDAKNNKLYKKLYRINFGKDLKPFDIIVNTNNLNKNQVFKSVCKALDLFLNK